MSQSTRWAEHPTANHAFEKHYKIAELAKMWGIGVETLRKYLNAEPDVPYIPHGTGRSPRIPEPIARRIHTKLRMPPQ
jgi:hypothetical protein